VIGGPFLGIQVSRVVPDGRHRASCIGTGRMDDISYVGLDVHKATVCVALAERETQW
jgi:hypothetical protein